MERNIKKMIKKLSAKQKKYLKKLIDKDITVIQIGKDGLKEETLKHINEVLDSNELIKIKVLDTDTFPVKEMANNIKNKTNSVVIRVIGKTIIIYRESNTLEDDEKINLPM